MLFLREFDQLLNVPENENIEQSDLCVKEKDTTICGILWHFPAIIDIAWFWGQKKNQAALENFFWTEKIQKRTVDIEG